MEPDPVCEIVGGLFGAGLLLLAWSMVRLGLAIEGLSSTLDDGADNGRTPPDDVSRHEKG